MCATGRNPMRWAVCVASAERAPAAQKKTNRLSCADASLWYLLKGSIQNSSMPRGQWNAPGIRPSRASSRISRRSTNTTSLRPLSLIASATSSVSISRSAPFTKSSTGTKMFCGIVRLLESVSRRFRRIPRNRHPAPASTWASAGTRQPLAGPAGQPVDREPDELARGSVGKRQPLDDRRLRPIKFTAVGELPVDRKRLDLEIGVPEGGHRARHMIGGGHYHPALTGFRRREDLAELRILQRVTGSILKLHTPRRDPEPGQQLFRVGGFRSSTEQGAVAAGEDDPRPGVALN